MKNIKKKDIIIFIFILLANVIIFKEFLKEHYTTDSYNLIGIGYINYLKENFLTGGRIFSALMYYIAFILKIPYLKFFSISLFAGLLISNVTFIKLKQICFSLKDKWNPLEILILVIASYYTIFNAMYLENLYFAETFIMSLSVYLYMLAAKCFYDKKNNYMIKAIIFLILGMFCYQGSISAFFAFLILFEFLKDKNILKACKTILLACFPVVIAILVNMLQIKIVSQILHIQQARLNFNLFYNFYRGLVNTIKIFMNTICNGYYFYIIILVITCTLIYTYINPKNDKIILKLIMIVLVCIGAAIIPSLSTGSAMSSARIRFSVGACIGLIFLFLVTKTEIFRTNKIITIFLTAILLVYGVCNTYNYINTIKISKEINKNDIRKSKEIIECIEKYEEENKIDVKYIAIYIGININLYKEYYENPITPYHVMNWSALRTTWSTKQIIEYLGNRKLTERKLTEQEKENYLNTVDKEKNWLIKDDTIYITCYIN